MMPDPYVDICLFCGQPALLDHACDGKQGHVEALYGAMGDVPFETGSDTSAAAASSLRDDDLSRLEALVYATLKVRPRTCDDVEAGTGLSHQTVSARIRGLVLRGRVVDSGRREKTRQGRNAVVWRIATAEDRTHAD